jgi:Holliday junction resolvase RusA-like endonuclease
LKVSPGTHVRVTRGDRWIFKSTDEYLKDYDKRKGSRSFNRKQQLVRANDHREELRWNCKKDGFELAGGEFIMVFMKHMPKTWKKGVRRPGKRDLMAWKPMESRPDIDNYVKKILDSLMSEDKKIWCLAPLKVWVPDEIEEGTYFINVPEFFDFVVKYLKEKLLDDLVLR